MVKKIRCPGLFCRSKQCVPVSENRYKVGKGLVAGAIGSAISPAGAIVGLASGLNGKKKVKFMCQKCGRVFTAKV